MFNPARRNWNMICAHGRRVKSLPKKEEMYKDAKNTALQRIGGKRWINYNYNAVCRTALSTPGGCELYAEKIAEAV